MPWVSVPILTFGVGVSVGPLHGTVLTLFSSEIRCFWLWEAQVGTNPAWTAYYSQTQPTLKSFHAFCFHDLP